MINESCSALRPEPSKISILEKQHWMLRAEVDLLPKIQASKLLLHSNVSKCKINFIKKFYYTNLRWLLKIKAKVI